jgi:hypothetical protein
MRVLIDECVDPRVKTLLSDYVDFQQNLAKFQIGLVEVQVPKNQLRYCQAAKEKLFMATENVRPGGNSPGMNTGHR